MEITLNSITFTLLVQKLQNDKYAQCTPHWKLSNYTESGTRDPTICGSFNMVTSKQTNTSYIKI